MCYCRFKTWSTSPTLRRRRTILDMRSSQCFLIFLHFLFLIVMVTFLILSLPYILYFFWGISFPMFEVRCSFLFVVKIHVSVRIVNLGESKYCTSVWKNSSFVSEHLSQHSAFDLILINFVDVISIVWYHSQSTESEKLAPAVSHQHMVSHCSLYDNELFKNRFDKESWRQFPNDVYWLLGRNDW